MATWNPWHGCHKISAGCQNCYVYRIDTTHDKDSSIVAKTRNFDLAVRRGRNGEYKLICDEYVYTCFSSDFFLEDADQWRTEAWQIIRMRADLHFFIVTKRVNRFFVSLPEDWGIGYDNVSVSCTVENQAMADYRLPFFNKAPIKHKSIICEPLLEQIDLSPYLGNWIEQVVVGGESGSSARVCDYSWVLHMRRQCVEMNVPFHFKQTGYRFKKDGRIFLINRRFQCSQACKAGIDYPQ